MKKSDHPYHRRWLISLEWGGGASRRSTAIARPCARSGRCWERLSRLRNRAPIFAPFFAQKCAVCAKSATRARQSRAPVGDRRAPFVSLRPDRCISLQRLFGQIFWSSFLAPLEKSSFSHICLRNSQLSRKLCLFRAAILRNPPGRSAIF